MSDIYSIGSNIPLGIPRKIEQIVRLQNRIAQLEADLAEARKVISVVDGLVTAKGRYHTAQWYQKMVTALDEYKAAVKEQGK